MHFFTTLFDGGLGYSCLNSARGALSSVIDLADSQHTTGSHPLIIRFLKGVFHSRPTLPRYAATWDVSSVLLYLKNMPGNDVITLKDLSFKTVMLCLLVTGCRGQTVHLLNLQHMQIREDAYVFHIKELLKQSRPGKSQPAIKFTAYPSDTSLCVVSCLREYISRTESLRTAHGQLFISYQKPHKPVSRTTISRWVRATLAAAGIDTCYYKPHSTRSASTSAAAATSTPLDTILKTAGWTSASTFAKYYHKRVEQSNSYSDNVLSCIASESTLST